MISNELVLTDTNLEFARVRFEFVAIYFSIPAAPLEALEHLSGHDAADLVWV